MVSNSFSLEESYIKCNLFKYNLFVELFNKSNIIYHVILSKYVMNKHAQSLGAYFLNSGCCNCVIEDATCSKFTSDVYMFDFNAIWHFVVFKMLHKPGNSLQLEQYMTIPAVLTR